MKTEEMTFEEMLARLDAIVRDLEKGEAPLVVVCDEISDPHNLGAIIRTAECAGAHGIIIPKHRSAGITAVVEKTSAGAVEHMAVARVVNLAAALKELQEAGANVCLGTDGAASSNTVDMLEHMKNSAMVQKAWRKDPAALPLNDLLSSATVNGARALGINTGEIKEGKLADLSLIDLGGTAFISPAPTLANLVYAAHSDVITDVMAGGKWIMRDRTVPNEAEILHEARKVLKQI